MVAKNDITGDSIQSRTNSKAYEENMDRIFGDKSNERAARILEKEQYFARLAAETKTRIENFDLESLDPTERSWYYDNYGVRRKKEKSEE